MTVIAYADGIDSARLSPAEAARAAGVDPGDVEVFLGWTPEAKPWLTDPGLRGRTVIAGWELAKPVADGRLAYVAVRLSSLPRLMAMERPDVGVVTGVQRGDRLAFGASAGWGPALVRAAGAVVVEVDADAPDLGAPLIDGPIAAVVDRPPGRSGVPVPRGPDAVDLAVGRNVVSILPDDPTLQLGPGGIAEAIVASLDRPVRVWSGLLTDAMAGLLDRGLLVGALTGAYAWGGAALIDAARAGRLDLQPLEVTHDLTAVSAIDRFVGCNTALQVGLDGAVNVERIGRRYVAGLGGHADFCSAAARSVGGISLIALRSTTRDGASTIVPDLAVVSTPRCDVEVVATEHGVADLRGVDDAERVRRMIAIAAPEHRETLTKGVR